MIINIRGTSGSGKTTLVRRVIELYGSKIAFKEPDRKQPIGYLYARKLGDKGKSLAIIGHYETTCGGCDTISKMEKIFELVRTATAAGHDVIYEGLLISADVVRTAALHQDGLPLKVIALDVPLEVCLDSVNGRRQRAYQERLARVTAENEVLAAKGRKLLELPEERGDVNPANTASKFKGVQQSMKRLLDLGINAQLADRDAAFQLIREELSI